MARRLETLDGVEEVCCPLGCHKLCRPMLSPTTTLLSLQWPQVVASSTKKIDTFIELEWLGIAAPLAGNATSMNLRVIKVYWSMRWDAIRCWFFRVLVDISDSLVDIFQDGHQGNSSSGCSCRASRLGPWWLWASDRWRHGSCIDLLGASKMKWKAAHV